MRKVQLVLCVGFFALCCTCVAQAAEQKAAEKEYKKIRIGDRTGYVMPDEVVRSLGLPREDIPDERNAATYYTQAMNAMPPRGEEPEDAYEVACKRPWGPEEREIYAWFQKTAKARRLMRKAVSAERCQFPIMTSTPGGKLLAGFLLPYLAKMRSFARLLVIEGHLREKQGKLREALDCYLSTMALGRHTAEEPFLISGLVAIAVQSIGGRAIGDCLERHKLSDDVLKWLGERLAESSKALPDRSRWIIGERAMAMQFAYMPADEVLGMTGKRGVPANKVSRSFFKSRAFRIVWPDRTIRKDFAKFYSRLEEMAENLNDQYIFSWKPAPVAISTPEIDEVSIRAGLRKALDVTKGCVVEMIMKDNHTIGKRPENVVNWCRIARQEVARST